MKGSDKRYVIPVYQRKYVVLCQDFGLHKCKKLIDTN